MAIDFRPEAIQHDGRAIVLGDDGGALETMPGAQVSRR